MAAEGARVVQAEPRAVRRQGARRGRPDGEGRRLVVRALEEDPGDPVARRRSRAARPVPADGRAPARLVARACRDRPDRASHRRGAARADRRHHLDPGLHALPVRPPLVWVEELASYAFIWSVFIGAALGIKELRHIRIDTFVVRLAPATAGVRARSALGARHVRGADGRDRGAARSCRSRRAAARWRCRWSLTRHLFYSVPLFASLASMAFTGCYLVVAELAKALTGRPVEAELEVARRRRQAEEREAAP